MSEHPSSSLVALQSQLDYEPDPVVPPRRKRRAQSATLLSGDSAFIPDLTVDYRYISDLDLSRLGSARTLIVKSPIGTGKTGLAAHLIRRKAEILGRPLWVLVITHRQALAEDLTNRLNRELPDTRFECYKGRTAAELGQINYLVICVNSLLKLPMTAQPLRRYDVIIIDEVEQVLNHLNGETFSGGQAFQVHHLLGAYLKQADEVVVMDADAGPITRDWLTALRPSRFIVTNTHIHDRGIMVNYENRDRLVADADCRILDEQGPVVFATNSIKEAKTLERYYVDRYGDDSVYMICSDNSDTREAQTFLRTINEQLPKLKVFIYTPSLGTGVDIRCRVHVMCGIFHAEPLAAPELHQMLGRCRKVGKTLVYIQAREQNLETSADDIYDRACRNAGETGRVCGLNEEGIWDVTEPQKSLMRLLSRLEAQRNQSMKRLYDHFTSMATGYRLRWKAGTSTSVHYRLRSTQEAVAADWKRSVLNTDPVDYETYDRLRSQGDATPEIKAGHERYLIEDLVGCPITPEIYDDLEPFANRKQLRWLTDLVDQDIYLIAADYEQASQNERLNKRRHRVVCRDLLLNGFVAVFGPDWSDPGSQLTEAQIEEKLKPYLDAHERSFKNQLKRRGEASREPLAVLRWMLKLVGLTLENQQVMRQGKRSYLYFIAPETLQKMQTYAQSRLNHLMRRRKA